MHIVASYLEKKACSDFSGAKRLRATYLAYMRQMAPATAHMQDGLHHSMNIDYLSISESAP